MFPPLIPLSIQPCVVIFIKYNVNSEPFQRLFVIEKLRSLVLHIPNETLILAAKTILDDFKQYHSKYAQFVSTKLFDEGALMDL